MTDLDSKASAMKERLKDFVEDKIVEAADDFDGEGMGVTKKGSPAEPD